MNFSIKELNELIYSLGITATNGRLCDKELNASLLEKLYCELNFKLSWEDEELSEKEEWLENRLSEDSFPHYVTNEEADEDAKVNDKFNGVSQFILDFVEANGAVSFTEMNDMYKAYTKGSNSFSHILKALRIPYKNRPTRRYLKKMLNGAYTIDIANPINWVVSDYDYRTFNEAPYGE
jgi:hypothetical protein